MMLSLPETVVFEILLWLPVVSLLRFKSVCKTWFSFLESPSFITKHLHHPHHQHHDYFIFKNRLLEPEEKFYLVSPLSESLLDSPPFVFNEDSRYWDRELEMVASCDGIICLHHRDSGELALWNPATKQYRLLPESSYPTRPYCVSTPKNYINHGFGYDVKTNDYKVVRIVMYHDEHYQMDSNQIEVYNLSSNSWRILDTVLPVDYMTYCLDTGRYWNGIYFWLARNTSTDDETMLRMHCHLILTFDMTNEVFGTMPLPDVCAINHFTQILALFSESIACFNLVFVGERPTYQVWVLNEYPLKESWDKLYMFGPLPRPITYPQGFLKNGDIVFNLGSELVFCNPITQEMKNLQLAVHLGTKEVVVYKESLVSIKGGNSVTFAV